MRKEEITFDTLPQAVALLLEKMEVLEKRMLDHKSSPAAQPDYVTIKEAIEILRGTVVIGTIYNWKLQGKIDSIKVGRKLLFKRADIEAMLKGEIAKAA
jgi:hypothetical protein